MRTFLPFSVTVVTCLCFLLLQVNLYAESLESFDTRIHEIEEKLKHLPIREPGESGGNAGLLVVHYKESEPILHSVTIDLEEVYPIDQIALVPTRLEDIERQMEAVGFPIRFELIGSTTADFSAPVSFYNGADENYPDPNGYPVIFNAGALKARYIRLVVYDMPTIRRFRAFSLAEFFVFSGGRNVALQKTVDAPTSQALDAIFDKAYLVDGQTSMGQPVAHNGPRPSWRGWHADVQSHAMCDETVELQFEHSHVIEEVRLYPVYHSLWPKNVDYGFPIRFRLQIKQAHSEWITVEDWSKELFPRPGNSPVSFSLGGRPADAVRLQALTIPNSAFRRYTFALAEMEVYANGVNIAPTGEVISSSLYRPAQADWDERALTDGFATRGKIMPLLTWLKGLAKRGTLEAELASLIEARSISQARLTQQLRTTVIVLFAALLLAGCMMLYNRGKQKKYQQQLQSQIASDLHDEVGSNLASITILASAAKDQCEPNSSLAKSLQRTVDISKETASSMRDIIWVLHPNRKNKLSLTTRLQDITASLLADIDYTLAKSENILVNQLSMNTLHHFLLFYKEALHNLTKHSKASEVDIILSSHKRTIRLVIIDNGIPLPSGSLPKGLRLRAQKIPALLSYQRDAEENRLSLEIT